jgi:membrane-associated phospholipid phosphatase
MQIIARALRQILGHAQLSTDSTTQLRLRYFAFQCKVSLVLLITTLTLIPVQRAAAADDFTLDGVWTDTKLYFTAPLRWDTQDWLYFGGAIAAVGAAHQFDGRVRDHFQGPNPVLDGKDPHSTRDAIPAAALVAGTWAFGLVLGEKVGRVEAYTMLEAAMFSTITAETLKYATGRSRPSETRRVDDWRSGGSSFPSLHTTAAFAIGTVFAESGGDDYRIVRRVLGYGVAGYTAYRRLHDSQHWLSDTVAGGAIGISTAAFTLNRREARSHPWTFSVSPSDGGGVAMQVTWTPH